MLNLIIGVLLAATIALLYVFVMCGVYVFFEKKINSTISILIVISLSILTLPFVAEFFNKILNLII